MDRVLSALRSAAANRGSTVVFLNAYEYEIATTALRRPGHSLTSRVDAGRLPHFVFENVVYVNNGEQ